MISDLPLRPRDFIEDYDGWLYAVSRYDNTETVGSLLRYIPDLKGERVDSLGRRYTKCDFEDAYALIQTHRPTYSGLLHEVPYQDILRVLKPEREISQIAERVPRVKRILEILDLPTGSLGCTGSLLCGLERPDSDIDLVVYGSVWPRAQNRIRDALSQEIISPLSDEMWIKIYQKRKPEISYPLFRLHEARKWNRGQIENTYFDLLYTRDYQDLTGVPSGKGEVLERMIIEAEVTDARNSFDNPAVYLVDHELITEIHSFTHTYSGQAHSGERIEAAGVCEKHGDEHWLIVGTTREARGEYIISRTLIDQNLSYLSGEKRLSPSL